MDMKAFAALNEARDCVTRQILSADTLTEIEAAKQVLRDWLNTHPGEQGMRDGFEQLYTLQEIIEEEDARRASEQKRVTPPAADAAPLLLEQRSKVGAAK